MKVPIYQEQVKSADQVSYGGAIKTTVENFGGGGANIATQLEPAVKIYQEQKKKADQIRVNEAEARLTELETRLLYDKDSGALHKKGKNSFGAYEETSTEYDKRVLEIENELSNDEQKGMLRQSALQKKLSIDRQLQNHISQETVRYDNEATASAIKMEGIAAQENYKDLSRIQLSIDNQKKYMDQFIERNGLSKEEADLKKSQIISGTHEDVINRMLSNDYELGAQEYLKLAKEKKEISGDSLTRVEKAVEAGTNRKQAQDSVDNYLAKGLSESAAYKSAANIEDSKLREETEQRISLVYNRKEASQRAAEEQQYKYLSNQILKVNGDVSKIPGWDNVQPTIQEKVKAYAGSITQGKQILTKADVFNKLKDMAINPAKRNDFASENLGKYINDLSSGDMAVIEGWQNDLRAGKNDRLDGVLTQTQAMKNSISQAGYKGVDAEAMENQINKTIELHEKQSGKPLTPVQVTQLSDELLTKSVVKFWSNKRPIDLTVEQIDDIEFDNIPKAEIEKIKLELSKSVPPIPAVNYRILDKYKNNLKRLKGIK